MGTSVSSIAGAEGRATARDLPGIRTFQSPRFRTIVAATIWIVAALLLVALLLRQAANPVGQYGFDFGVYYVAASNLTAGISPYAAEMFTGPIPAQGALLYKYPPMFAQLLVPLTAVSSPAATATWVAIQGVAVFGATWLAARLGGVPRTVEAFCWCGAATTLFLPNFDTIWKGNVSGILAFLTAMALVGGAAGGLGVVSSVLVKTTPVVMVPAALVAGRRAISGLLLGAAAAALSIVIAPAAWIDFVRVFPNLVSGPADFPTNLAPDIQVQLAFPSVPVLATLTRVVAVGLGGVAIVLSVLAARRDGWPAAVALGVAATLLLPSATWYHYLAPLLPLAAFAWPRATQRARAMLFAGAAFVTIGLVYLPLAVAGAAFLVVGALWVLWPRRREATV